MKLLLITLLASFPIIEIVVFISVSERIGLSNTLIIAILTTLSGFSLLRYQGLSILNTMHKNFSLSSFSMEQVSNRLYLILSAIMLILPGLASDIIGILILLPPTRYLLKTLVATLFLPRIHTNTSQNTNFKTTDKNVIDGEFQDITEIESPSFKGFDKTGVKHNLK